MHLVDTPPKWMPPYAKTMCGLYVTQVGQTRRWSRYKRLDFWLTDCPACVEVAHTYDFQNHESRLALATKELISRHPREFQRLIDAHQVEAAMQKEEPSGHVMFQTKIIWSGHFRQLSPDEIRSLLNGDTISGGSLK